MTIEVADTVLAVFAPACTDDLKPSAAAVVGELIAWEALWVIETGPYAGQRAMRSLDDRLRGWVPESDLAIPAV